MVRLQSWSDAKKVFWSEYRRYFPTGVRLVWPILLGLGVAVAAPLPASVRVPGQGPWLVVVSLGNLVGPAKPPCFFGLTWWNKPGPDSFEEKPWNGLFLKKSPEWGALFQRKRALTECSPWASCYLRQKVGGSWILIIGKTKKLF
jgi:hypothetical protein